MKALLSVLALPLLAQQGVNFYSLQKERALGDALAAEIALNSKAVAIPAVEEYVNAAGRKLAAAAGNTAYEYSFRVILTDAVEPMPLPGGFIFIPARFLVDVRNEGEFAAVLAHCMGHVALRHGTRSATVGSSRVDLQACKLEYSIVSPK